MEIRLSQWSILFWVSLSGLFGCSSAAKRPVACDDGMRAASFYSWVYFLEGATIQQGDCALIEPLKIETGGYYGRHRNKIIDDVKSGAGLEGVAPGTIYFFAKSFNCSEVGVDRFNVVLLEEKEKIFGQNFENSDRAVTLNVMGMIAGDRLLSNECK